MLNTEKMLTIGKEWINGNNHRIYFNDLAKLLGLVVEKYNTGSISYAELNGQKISNSSASKMISNLYYAKVWFDFTTEKFESKNISSDDFNTIVEKIKEIAE